MKWVWPSLCYSQVDAGEPEGLFKEDIDQATKLEFERPESLGFSMIQLNCVQESFFVTSKLF